MEVIFIIIVAVSYIISMRRFILSENGFELIKGKILRESYSDKIDLVKRFLDKNFMRASTQKDGKDVGIFEIGRASCRERV